MTMFVSLLFLLAVDDPARTVTFGRSFGGEALPTFDKGYLLFQVHPNTIEVWDPQGQLQFRRAISDCNGISSIAVDTDGSFAVNCAHTVNGMKRGGVVLLDRGGKTLSFFDTGRYMPAHIGFDSKHELWSFGWQRDESFNDGEDKQDYLMFRKWSRAGKQLAAYVERSKFPRPGLSPGGPQGGLWRMQVSGGWIGALADSGKVSISQRWIQFREDGSELTISDTGPKSSFGTAFSIEMGLCRVRKEPKSAPVIERFDVPTTRWKAVGEAPTAILLGADKDALVFGSSDGNIRLAYLKLKAE